MTRENYVPIPGLGGRGYTALSVYPPGVFMPGDNFWMPFVGGSGVGRCVTAEDARQLLLTRAIEECERHIRYAQRTLAHYESAKAVLQREGLVRES